MSDAKRSLRPPFGPSRRRPRDGRPSHGADDLTRTLRDEYATPEEPRYWDALEARIVAAVRDGAARASATTTGAFRAVPAVAVEWWHALARWAQPGLAAAGVALVIAAGVFIDARATAAASRAHSAFQDVLDAPLSASPVASPAFESPALTSPSGEGPALGGSVLDAGLARAGDDAASDDPDEQARIRRDHLVDELLSGGLVRRHASPHERAAEQERARPADPDAAQRRDATFRELLPE